MFNLLGQILFYTLKTLTIIFSIANFITFNLMFLTHRLSIWITDDELKYNKIGEK